MKIGIFGCAGRMGRMLGAAALATDGVDLIGGTEKKGSVHIGKDQGTLATGEPIGIKISDDSEGLVQSADVVIDFTVPVATVTNAMLAAAHGTSIVIGTTGLNDKEMEKIVEAGKKSTIVHAGNMSLGVNLLVGLAAQVAKALGPEFDIEVLEMHHKHKIDAPSGTALMLGRAAAEGRGVVHDNNSVMSREGYTGEREQNTIGYATLRGGNVVGDHKIMFSGADERVELVHKAGDRSIFARGAIRAAQWTEGKNPGLYTMRDVLGLI
ncbi:MAG: 4-hydroxy-tetrahydrodipicolinate reductase [Magnetovibrio sp.]|nr:4-hydroxy-tetrahydrodipicolinate reductase [Magnetovibrio sp.]|tara:strand:+ start:528 stop:1328 length:801 start_codon:yes stop_codon:yes gene_type:complete